jgi:hypothetical protein
MEPTKVEHIIVPKIWLDPTTKLARMEDKQKCKLQVIKLVCFTKANISSAV